MKIHDRRSIMALRAICVYPDPVLREETERVEDFDGELKSLIDDMFETMYASDGIGAPRRRSGSRKSSSS
ncbi:MAG: peptide deformylase [Cloacibacillus evryensis]